jgi:ketohexokinase
MAQILCVGIATLDIVNRVARYPAEDSEVRALSQCRRMGGNAANTAIVLAQLGAQASWVGNLAPSSEPILRTFERFRVDAGHAVTVAAGVTPTSYITLSEATGSRSIVHYRDLPEYRAQDFRRLDLGGFDWLHFEGRAPGQLAQMLEHARQTGLPVSLEVEKPRPGIETLFGQAEVLMFSRYYALAQGFDDAPALLRSLPGGTLATCTWGERGAWAIDRDGQLQHVAAPRPDRVIDTVGAGDVFNAAMLHGLSRGLALQPTLQAAVALASTQCGVDGLELPDG